MLQTMSRLGQGAVINISHKRRGIKAGPTLVSFWDVGSPVVWVIYHFTPFSREFPGPKSYRHPGPPPPLRWCGGAISCPKGT